MFRRFFSYYRPYRKLLILDVLTAIFGAAFTLLIPVVVGFMLKDNMANQSLRGICIGLAVIAALAAFDSVTKYINTFWGHVLGTRMEADMRSDLFRHLQKLSHSYFDNTKTGHLISRIANDLFNVAELAHHGPEDLLISFIMIVGSFGFMLWYNVPLALIALIPLPFMVGWAVIFGTKMRRSWRQVRRRIADINSDVENAIQGIREVKSFAKEPHEIERFDETNASFREAKEGMYGAMAGFHGGMTFLMQTYSLVIVGGGVVLAYYGKIEVAEIIVFMLYSRFVQQPLRRLSGFVEQFQQGVAAFERFVEIMDVEPEIVDRPGAVKLDTVRGDVKMEGISFRYDGTHGWALRDVSLHIPAGKTVALVGESGAGKSTLAALIPRFYEAQCGTVSIDGHNVLDLQQRWLRKNIGIVQQNVFLFDSTLRENIMFGRPEATEDELIEAARSANILSFIQSLPDGFDSLVGEHGVKLSGGQKQRVSIARVFLKNPPILIFDEATSSLDTESEQLIKQAMSELCANRTTLIIAHRFTTVRSADHTYVMREGCIVEDGHHDELIDGRGYYSELYAQSTI